MGFQCPQKILITVPSEVVNVWPAMLERSAQKRPAVPAFLWITARPVSIEECGALNDGHAARPFPGSERRAGRVGALPLATAVLVLY